MDGTIHSASEETEAGAGSQLVSSGAQSAACIHPHSPHKEAGLFPRQTPERRALGTSQPGSVILRTQGHGHPELVHAGSAPPWGVGRPGGRPAAAFSGLLRAQRADFTPHPPQLLHPRYSVPRPIR